MHTKDKDILAMINIVCEDITKFVKRENIDTIVNPAKPTLMGGDEPSVDYEIHKAINQNLKKKKFKDKIRQEVDGKNKWGEDVIRCERGKVVVTKGYSLCKTVFHVVGHKFDGDRKNNKIFCTSSCVQKLEACYREIIKDIKSRQGIEKVAIPIIGAGNYEIPYEVAVRVALATVANELVDWKNRDREFFDFSALKKIYFCIYHRGRDTRQVYYDKATEIWNEYRKIIKCNNKVVYQTTTQAHFSYLLEIKEHDGERGYFAVARSIRLVLLVIRILFIPVLLFKDILGGYNWHKRRVVVEITALLKLGFPVIIYFGIRQNGLSVECERIITIITAGVIYLMLDTITYLVLLIVLSDIQRPSANVIRSMIFLLINYLEVSFDIGAIFYIWNLGRIDFWTAIQFGIMPDFLSDSGIADLVLYRPLLYVNNGIKFFFMTLAFGYFANHLRQREFLS